MPKFKVNTGLGYLKDLNENIIAKCELPPGDHELTAGYSYVELNSKEDLDKIKVYTPPVSDEEIREKKIQAEIRKMAEERLVARGEL